MSNSLNFELNCMEDAVTKEISTVQYNKNIPIKITLRDYEPDSGMTARIYCKKPSGNCVYNDCTLTGNSVSGTLTSQMTAEEGKVECMVQLMSQNKVIYSFNFLLWVVENICDENAVKSSNEFTALENALIKAYAAAEATEAATAAAKSASDAATAASTALKNIDAAVQGTLINDTTPSLQTTFSGQKIQDIADQINNKLGKITLQFYAAEDGGLNCKVFS